MRGLGVSLTKTGRIGDNIWSLLLTFPRVALREKIAPDEAEDEDFGYSKARTTTKYGAILSATQGSRRAVFARWDGSLRAWANFPDFCVIRR
jgi:hypothetical protein